MSESIYDHGRRRAQEFRWVRSDEAGRDLGPAAEREWYAQQWWGFVRECLVDHLWGLQQWAEFPASDFGSIPAAFPGHSRLLREIAARVAGGADNLGVLSWAVQYSHPIGVVGKILSVANVNRFQLFPPPEDDADTPFIVGPG